ncbi:EF-hand domain-containing protein [Actinophytocola sediminis]
MSIEAVDRVGLIFTLFDANGSGEIEANDFELMADRVVKAAPRSDDAAKEAIVAAFRRYWATLAEELDKDRNGRINREEYQAIVLSPARFESTIAEFAQALAHLGDPDGNGLVERPVFTALMIAIGFARTNIDALFDAYEPNGDDQVAASTWESGIREFYQPDAADITGDLLVPSAG